MIDKLIIAGVSAVLSIVFSAGGAWFMLKQLRRDVNGIGLKTHRLQIVVLMYCPEDQRKELGKLFLLR